MLGGNTVLVMDVVEKAKVKQGNMIDQFPYIVKHDDTNNTNMAR